MSMLYLTEQNVRDLLPMQDCIELMQTAFERLAVGRGHQPAAAALDPAHRLRAALHGRQRRPILRREDLRDQSPHGAHFLFLLYRAADAQPLAMLEANHLGQIRTGAASGLATKFMAREDAATLAIIGSGFQARTQLEAMLAVRKISQGARLEPRSRQARCLRRGVRGPTPAPSKPPKKPCAARQIVVTATNAKEPVLSSEWIEPGTHINVMGSNQANRREIPRPNWCGAPI
jgi:alanine dehydrogenase